MDKKNEQNRLRQERFRQRMIESGQRRQTVWVHRDDVDKLKQFVEELGYERSIRHKV